MEITGSVSKRGCFENFLDLSSEGDVTEASNNQTMEKKSKTTAENSIMKDTETSNEEVKTEDGQTSITLESLEDDNFPLEPMDMAFKIYLDEYVKRNLSSSMDSAAVWKLGLEAGFSFKNLTEKEKVDYAIIYKERQAELWWRYKEYQESYSRQLTEEQKKILEQKQKDYENNNSGENVVQYCDSDDEEMKTIEMALLIYLEEFVAEYKKKNPNHTKTHCHIASEGQKMFCKLSDKEIAEYAERYKKKEAEKEREF